MKEILTALSHYSEVENKINECEAMLKKLKEQEKIMAENVLNLFQENQIKPPLKIKNFSIKAFNKIKFIIQGGEKQSKKRTVFLSEFEEFGYDEGRIQTFKGLDERFFQKKMFEISEKNPVQIHNWKKRGLVEIITTPKIEIRKLKAKKEPICQI
jgi:hypothetical protein